jgi:sirohydrochlorin cobaltochelatase
MTAAAETNGGPLERPDALVLVGHGAVPSDCPREFVTRLKQLETERRGTGAPPGAEERRLDAQIRAWPRRPETDPYQAGLEALAERLRACVDGAAVVVAYNEFCAPTLEEAAAALVAAGHRRIAVVPSMLTPGGIHAEVEIPATLARLRAAYPGIVLRYAWPFDLHRVARLLAEQALRPG